MIMAILAVQSLRDWGLVGIITFVIYLLFLLLGVGFSSYITFSECQKTDAASHFKQASLWALYPTVAYFLMRVFSGIRVYFDRFYRGFDSSDAGKTRAGWISIGYVMMLGCLVGLFPLIDYSVESVCIPTIDEATRFREAMMLHQKKKAELQETTPAVSVVQ
jgi:hypothetical protein